MLFDKVLFLDLEPYSSDTKNKPIREIGLLIDDLAVKNTSAKNLSETISPYDIQYICGHNLRVFDMEYLSHSALNLLVYNLPIIDTLELSLLLFSENTVHKLPKTYKENDPKLISDPLEDAHITKILLGKIVEKYIQLPDSLKRIYYLLLGNTKQFKPFFELINEVYEEEKEAEQLKVLIIEEFDKKIQSPDNLISLIKNHPIELAYIVSVLHDTIELKSFPLKVFKDYDGIQELLNSITFNKGKAIEDLEKYALDYFGFDGFNSFPKLNSNTDLFAEIRMISQKEIVQGALEREDLLAVLPTGGGKTFAFWLPAIIKAKSTRSLTVVISPLQALMKDHIFNFNKKLAGLASAEALSGYLTLPERRSIINRIINGGIDILYLAPESLRSKNIERILSYRYIERIVIDEAHCLSTWGNDFRHDYFYIAQFIQKLLDKKYNQGKIPISCFTATANKRTIEDIEAYFFNNLGVTFKEYIASPKRTNLTYEATHFNDKKDKTKALVEKVRQIKEPLLIYNPSSRRQCELIAEQLNSDLGRSFSPFHAGMRGTDKQQTLDDYIDDNVDGIIATTAFGMGIDKPNIRYVIHYEPSSSLEDYMQEAGRAGRDRKPANCHMFYNDNDFDKLFFSLIRQKVTQPEIKKIFQAIRRYKGKVIGDERKVVVSVQELADSAGIAVDEEQMDFDTKVKTAVLELERTGYVRRGYNKPNVWVTAFHFSSMAELHKKLAQYKLSDLSLEDKEKALFQSIIMIGQILIKRSGERFSMKIEELADLLTLDVDALYCVLDSMREMELVSLKEDLVIGEILVAKMQSLVKVIPNLKHKLIYALEDVSFERFKLKDLNQRLHDKDVEIKFAEYTHVLNHLLVNFSRRGVFEFYRKRVNDHYWYIKIINKVELQNIINEFCDVISAVTRYLQSQYKKNSKDNEKLVVPFETMMHYCNNELNRKVAISIYDKAVMFLHYLRLIRLEGGRVLHHMRIELFMDKELSANKQYTQEDYKQRMAPMYQRKRASIHIMNHYVELLTREPILAQEFSTDYFTMGYETFVTKYKLTKKLKLPVSKARYGKIRKGLTNEQSEIVFDDKSQTMLILAGPGTGKTMVMVNKIAHMILDEDYKPEHFLMLTYTRTAAHEFKRRLFDLLGDLAYDIDIYTFHGYATELAGISFNGSNNENSQLNRLIPLVTEKLKNTEITLPFKNAIVLDEFQDTNEESFSLIVELYKQFTQMKGSERENDVRIIAVGDDDQCIMEMTNGANIDFMRKFVESFTSENSDKKKWYRLSENFRSQSNIVDCCNTFASKIINRVDHEKVIIPSSKQMLEGKVYLTYYQTPDFFSALYNAVKHSTSETIAILAHENEQVLDIYSVLKQDPLLDVNYLLKNEGFHLSMMDEIVAFTEYLNSNLETNEKIISQTLFDDAKQYLRQAYAESSKLTIALQHIAEFESEHELLTASFWENYTYEVYTGTLKNIKSKIIVSTIHRAKGKEWDEVHVVLQKEHNMGALDYFNRLYYVAFSRAKSLLHIHTFPKMPFKELESKNIQISHNPEKQFAAIKKRILIMQLEDTYLSFLSRNNSNQEYVVNKKIRAGTKVMLHQYQYKIHGQDKKGFNVVHDNIVIGSLSVAFSIKLADHLAKGYKIIDTEVEYNAKWFDSENKMFLDVFLCRISLEYHLT